MEQQSTYNTATGIICGILGGFTHYLQISDTSGFLIELGKACMMALACGGAGVLGKMIIVGIKDKLFKKRNKN